MNKFSPSGDKTTTKYSSTNTREESKKSGKIHKKNHDSLKKSLFPIIFSLEAPFYYSQTNAKTSKISDTKNNSAQEIVLFYL
jgi:hypothetical protein